MQRFFIRPLFAALALCATLASAAHAAAPEEDILKRPSDVPGLSIGDLRKLSDAIVRTGVITDGIPALYRPKFLSVSDASLSMDDDEVVFIVHYPGERVRIYPQRILVWHEVVNDVLPDASGTMPPIPAPGMPVSGDTTYTLTYSPLTGSVVAFRSLAGRFPSTFGVTGNLLNANTVLYDRVSRSLWSQLLAVCIEGPLRGKRLERLPVLWAKWRGVKERYAGTGKAEVMSRSTGYKRSYGKDPYGSYHIGGTYYDNAQLRFPISRLDDRLPPKKRVLGLEVEDSYGAVPIDAVREARVINFTMGLTPLTALYDARLETVRVFDRRPPGSKGGPLTFEIFEDKLIDKETRSEWTPEGKGVYGKWRDASLTPCYAMDSMWFAWATFHRGTRIYPAEAGK